jgi:hypothetical protein
LEPYEILYVVYLSVNLQVQLSHTRYNGFLVVCVIVKPERGIFFSEASNSFAEVVSVLVVFWAD